MALINGSSTITSNTTVNGSGILIYTIIKKCEFTNAYSRAFRRVLRGAVIGGTAQITEQANSIISCSSTINASGQNTASAHTTISGSTSLTISGSRVVHAASSIDGITTVVGAAAVISLGSMIQCESSVIADANVTLGGLVNISNTTTVYASLTESSYKRSDLADLYIFLGSILGQPTENLIFRYPHSADVRGTENPVPRFPCNSGPKSDAMLKYEQAAKKSKRLKDFADTNNIEYFNNLC